MVIKKVKISELNKAKYNPRVELKKEDKAYKQIKASIEEFGYISPIIVNKNNMTIISGHQRLNVLIDLGYEEVDCIFVDVNERIEKRMNLALNNIKGYNDTEKLKELFNELELSEEEILATGFDIEEIEGYSEDFIEDLLNENYTDRNKAELKEFAITFNIDKKYENLFNDYIKAKGKSGLIDVMIKYIQESEVV